MTSEMADLLLAETDDKMEKAVHHARADFASIRTGRAAPALVEKIPVDYYGAETPLQQLAGFQVPEARQLLITPVRQGPMGAIEKALQQSDLGLNPSNDGISIRLTFPPLTQERRKELVKVVKHMAEEGKVALRNQRRTTRHDLGQAREGRRPLEGRAGAGGEGARQAHPRPRGGDRRGPRRQGNRAPGGLMAPDKLSRDPSQGGGESSEGVRIIAAEELEEVAERGEVARRRSPDEPGFKDRPPAPPADARPAIRFPLPDSADPSALERPRPAPVEAPRAEGSVPDRPRPETTPVTLGEEAAPGRADAAPRVPDPTRDPDGRVRPRGAGRGAPCAPRRRRRATGSAGARPRPVHRRAPAAALDRAGRPARSRRS